MGETAILSSSVRTEPVTHPVTCFRHILSILLLFTAACQHVEQGYWTKQGLSQSQFNAEYRRDFRDCARFGMEQGPINDGGPESDIIRARHVSAVKGGTNAFNECMQARGYEWITMQPLVGPNVHGSTVYKTGCPEDRVIVDPYGFPHCAVSKQLTSPRSIDVPREASLPMKGRAESLGGPLTASPEKTGLDERIPEPSPRSPATAAADRPIDKTRATAQQRSFDESLCIQLSQASLANPYETFLRCMEDKGWPSGTK